MYKNEELLLKCDNVQLRNEKLTSWRSTDVVSSKIFSYHSDFSDANHFIINFILIFPACRVP